MVPSQGVEARAQDLSPETAAPAEKRTTTLLAVGGLLAALALGAVGYGFYLVYRKPKVACAGGSYCAEPRSGRAAKTGLWSASVLVIVALAFPRLAPLFL